MFLLLLVDRSADTSLLCEGFFGFTYGYWFFLGSQHAVFLIAVVFLSLKSVRMSIQITTPVRFQKNAINLQHPLCSHVWGL